MARKPTRAALAVLACLPMALSATAPAAAFADAHVAAAALPVHLHQVIRLTAAQLRLPDRPEDVGPVPHANTAPATPAGLATQPAAPDPSDVPVLYLHGALLGPGCVGSDVTGPLAWLAAVLHHHGWGGAVRAVDYYCADHGRGSVDIRGTARPTADTGITDIARLLAWYVYRTYSSRGVAVDLVGHSMGGLIIRDALGYGGRPGFPPYLRVRDVVTISTPFTGIPARTTCPLQCRQMTYGSAYLTALSPTPPRGRGGTSWTEIGGSRCDYIPAASTLALDAALRVQLAGGGPVCYTHVSYLSDSSTARDMPATVTTPDGHVSHVTGPRPLEWVYQALLR